MKKADERSAHAIALSETEREDLGRELKQKIERGLSGRQDVTDRILRGRDQYDAVPKAKNFPWPGSSNINVPITRSILDSIHARVLRVMNGVSPFFKITPFKGEDVPYAQRIEEHLEWQMTTEVGLAGHVDTAVHMALRDGNAIGLLTWKKIIEPTKDRIPLDAKLRAELNHPSLKNVADGTMVEVEQDETIKNGPALEIIDLPNFVMYPHNARDIKSAILCGHRFWQTEDDLWRGVINGDYDEEWVEKLLDNGAEKPNPHDEAKGGDPDRLEDIGLSTWEDMDESERPFEFFHIVAKFDYDDRGVGSDCLFVIELSTGTIIQAETYPYWHKRRCYINFCPYPRTGSFYGYSLPEILEHLAAEVNAIRNQRVDAGTINLSPMMVARRGSRYDPNKHKWRPGGVLWLDSADDVKPLFVQANTQSAFTEEGAAREMAERVSGVSDYAQGQSPSRSRTLGEVQAVLQEGNLKFDVVIQRLQRGMNELAQQVLGLNRQYLDEETEYLIDRQDGVGSIFQTITKEDIVRRVGVAAHGNTLNSNNELEMQTAEKLYMMSERCQLMQKPTRIYRIVQNYLLRMGIKNVQPYIGTIEEASELEKNQQNAPPPPTVQPPSVSGKMDELTTLAVLLKNEPTLAEDMSNARALLAQLQAGGPPAPEQGGPMKDAPPQGGPMKDTPTGTGSNELDAMIASVNA